MNVLENDNTVTSKLFDDCNKALKEVDERVTQVFEQRIKGFQFFQEEHAKRFKITQRK